MAVLVGTKILVYIMYACILFGRALNYTFLWAKSYVAPVAASEVARHVLVRGN